MRFLNLLFVTLVVLTLALPAMAQLPRVNATDNGVLVEFQKITGTGAPTGVTTSSPNVSVGSSVPIQTLPSRGLPLPYCNPVRQTNCQPKAW